MSPEVLAYPFLLTALFFESFILVTLLSRPAREARARTPSETTPLVAIIVPCFNEAATVAATVTSLLALDYPQDKLEIVLVNDGSNDATPAAMERFARNPQVRIIHKENGGKHTALNAGLATTSADFVGCLDADSFVEPTALREILPCFADAKVAAVTAAMSIHQPKNFLEHMQNAEYIFGITLRHAISSVNGLYVTPGPFSFYRRSVVNELGGFRHGHQTEDMEMALRIQQAGYGIENAPRARVYTKAPRNVLKLVKQRTRWTTGFFRNIFGEYRGLIANRKYGALGMIVLPVALLSIAGGMLLFFVAIFFLVQRTLTAIEVRSGIPLKYALLPHSSFDWFYFPTSIYLILSATTILASLSLIVVGKRLSGAPGSLVRGLLSYSLMYGFIAPLWIIRATTDVTLGKRRNWR